MDKTDPLADFFAADAVPTADRGFRTAVMERIARRRLRIELAVRLLAGCLLIAGLAMMAPALQRIAGLLGHELSTVLPIVLIAVGIAFIGHRWLTDTLRLPSLRLRLF